MKKRIFFGFVSVLILAMIVYGCVKIRENSSSPSGTQSTDAKPETVYEPEPEPEPMTPREVFLDAREKQGISEEDVQEVLEELRGGPYIYFNLLSEDEQYVYAEIYIIATRFVTPESWEKKSKRSDAFYVWDSSKSISVEDISRISLAFEWDQMELVYTNHVYYVTETDRGLKCYVRWISRDMADPESWEKSKAVYDAEIESMRTTADEMLRDLPEGDDYTKARYIMEKICKRYTYQQSGPRYLYDIFQENCTQCEGYAKTFTYLAQRAGIEAGYMEGKATAKFNNEELTERGHAWNYVKLDGEYYYIDCTWADTDSGIMYYYLGMTDAMMEENGYFEDYKYAMIIKRTGGSYVDPREWLNLPACTATDDCYMYKNSANIIGEFSKSTLKEMATGKKKLILFFEDSEVGEQCIKYLIEDKKLKNIWGTSYTYYYPKAKTFLMFKRKE